jgi:hypothetical protein
MRLPYAGNPPKFENKDHQAFVDRIVKARGSHGLSPLDLALLHSPPFFKGFMQFFTKIRQESTLPPDIMELAVRKIKATMTCCIRLLLLSIVDDILMNQEHPVIECIRISIFKKWEKRFLLFGNLNLLRSHAN